MNKLLFRMVGTKTGSAYQLDQDEDMELLFKNIRKIRPFIKEDAENKYILMERENSDHITFHYEQDSKSYAVRIYNEILQSIFEEQLQYAFLPTGN